MRFTCNIGYDDGSSIFRLQLPDKFQSERHVLRIGLDAGYFAERATRLMHQVGRAVRIGR